MGIQSTMSMARYFLLLFFLSVGFFLTPTQYAHAALVSPVPLTRVMPTNQDSLTFGKPGNYQVPHFFFSYTQSYERCECGGGVDNGGSYTIQMCLNKLGFTVAEYGHGSPGMETNCIGAKTVDALAHFQNYFGFEEAGINHYGERTAIAGPITQTIMNYTCLGLEGDQEDGLAKSFTGKIETSISQPIFRRGSRSRAASSNNSVSVNTDTARFTFTKTGEFSDTNNDDAAQAGEFIDYTFTIENTGNVALAQLEIDDPLLAQTLIVCDDINITNGFSPLTFTNPIDADSTVQCEASYAIEPNDLLSTSLMNTATASAEGVDPITQQWEVVLPVDLVCNPQQLTQQFDIAYGDLTANNDRTFDLYPALNGQAEGTIVFFHGGGGEGREPGRAQDTLTADLIYLNQWFNIADVNYSYTMDAVNEPIPANRYPQSILDAKAAVNYIATNYDPRVYVMGVSFGGYLSNILATTQTSGPFGNAEMQAAASLYGVSDWSRSAGFYEPGASNPIDYDACQGFPNAPGPDCTILNNAAQTPDAFTWNFFGDTPVNVPAIAAQANPLNYVDANTAPLFLAHGTSDRVVPYNHSVWLADELNTAGVVNQFESRNVGHGSLQNDLSIRDGVRDFFRDQAPSCP